MTKLIQLVLLCSFLTLSGCATAPKGPVTYQDKNSRSIYLNGINQWQIKGKVAFLNGKEKQSANLFWQQTDAGLLLKLTTFLGINVLSIEQENGLYTLKSDGNTWQDENLEQLLTKATGLIMPVSAMKAWLKGLKATPLDQITYDSQNQLPKSLDTYLNNQQWQIQYSEYMQVDSVMLANKMTLKHNQLTIKVAIHSWELMQ